MYSNSFTTSQGRQPPTATWGENLEVPSPSGRYLAAMDDPRRLVDEKASETEFAGVVRLERAGVVEPTRRTGWPTGPTASR